MVSDDDRKPWGLSQRNQTPDAPPIWTPSSPQLPVFGIPLTVTLERGTGQVTHSSRQDCANEESQDVCRAVPAHHERLNSFSTAGPVGVMSSPTPPNAFSPPVHPPSFSDCGRPRAVLGSKHKDIDSEAGTSSSRIALRSLASRSRTSADQGTSMRARRLQRDPVPQSSNVTSNVTGARSDLAPGTFLSSSDDFFTTSRSSGLPLSQISNLPAVSLTHKDAKTKAVKRIPKLIPRPPPSRFVSKLLDQAFIRPDEASLNEDDPPCASGKARKGRRPNDYSISSRPRDTSSPDCSPPGDSGERIRL